MARSVAINVGANTNEPGFRGPIYADGSFEFVPIPETEPIVEDVATYGDLPLSFSVPVDVRDMPVHLDPEFAGYGPCTRFTYGDPFSVKARPLLNLEKGDQVYFYATLSYHGTGPSVEWIAGDWGTYLIGRFHLARDPLSAEQFNSLSGTKQAPFANNAHLKRESFDAAVLLLGDPEQSELFETAIPLSKETGVTPNRIVTEWSSDSGKGPWWRRPLRFDAAMTDRIRALESSSDTEKTELVFE